MLRNTREWMAWLLPAVVLLALVGCGSGTPVGKVGDPDAGMDDPAPATEVVAEPEAAEEAFTVEQVIANPYVPGESNRVVVTMNYTGDEPVTALALQTNLPMGWQYAGIAGELHPAIEPPAGARDVLTMVWIQVPSFPATVEYLLDAPEALEGSCTVTAQALYRTLGGELRSPVNEVTTTDSQ